MLNTLQTPRKSYVSGAYGLTEVFPSQDVNWDDATELTEYFRQLAVVRLLGARLQRRLESGAVFAADFYYLLNCTYSEWFGIFGYQPAQILPGLRVPLPGVVAARAFQDRAYFKKVSESYFGAYGLSEVFSKPRAFCPPGFFYLPAYAFLRSVEFAESKEGTSVFWRVTHPKSGVRYFTYDAGSREFSPVAEPLGQKWAVVSSHERFPAFFFPKPFRHFWGKDPQFFERFTFGGVFDAKAFMTMFEL